MICPKTAWPAAREKARSKTLCISTLMESDSRSPTDVYAEPDFIIVTADGESTRHTVLYRDQKAIRTLTAKGKRLDRKCDVRHELDPRGPDGPVHEEPFQASIWAHLVSTDFAALLGGTSGTVSISHDMFSLRREGLGIFRTFLPCAFVTASESICQPRSSMHLRRAARNVRVVCWSTGVFASNMTIAMFLLMSMRMRATMPGSGRGR